MILDIHERDIEPKLCRMCAACCRITFKLKNTTSRYRKFLRKIGYKLIPPAAEGQPDCCPGVHNSTVDMGYCRNLEVTRNENETSFRCGLYGSEEMPELCREFNCVSWAKAADNYSEKNSLLVSAQKALNQLRKRRE